MSSENSNRLFYVTKVSESTFSLYSISTDHLILSEVSKEVISDFLFLNEPTHPALSDEWVSQKLNSNPPLSSISSYSYDPYYSYPISRDKLDDIADNLMITLSDSLYESNNIYNKSCSSLGGYCIVDQTFFNDDYLYNDSDKQLSFNFNEKTALNTEALLKEFLDNPDNLIKAHKVGDILTKSINKATNSPPDLYLVGDNSDKGKSHTLEDDEWGYLDLDDN